MNQHIHRYLHFISCLSPIKIGNWLYNEFAYMVSQLIRRPLLPYFPNTLTIEPYNGCQLKCKECITGQGHNTRELKYISSENFQSTINQIYKKSIVLQFYWQGEPFLHPNWHELLEYATCRKLYTIVSSNGQNFTRDHARKLIWSGCQEIILSLDGATQASYSHYRQNGSIDDVIKCIQYINDERIKQDIKYPFMVVQCLVHSANEHELERVKHMALEAGADKVVFKSMQIYNDRTLLPQNNKYTRYKRANENWAIKRRHTWNCKRLWQVMVIGSNGNVYPCCYDKNGEFTLGNIEQTCIKECWTGTAIQEFRRKLLKQPYTMCENCW